jgi:hypothetical protein
MYKDKKCLRSNRKWITTWNDYLNDIKYFFRWIYNNKNKTENKYKENGEMEKWHHQIEKHLLSHWKYLVII